MRLRDNSKVLLLLTLAQVLACSSPVQDSEGEEQNLQHPCLQTKTLIEREEQVMVASCDVPFFIDGQRRSDTHFEFQLRSSRGTKPTLSGAVKASPSENEPHGTSLHVELTDSGYQLDAGAGGSVEVRPAPLDPTDPAASGERLIVDIVDKQGIRRSQIITCPGLVDYVQAIQEDGIPDSDSTDLSCSTPNSKTGCFPCSEFAALFEQQPALAGLESRTRIGTLHTLANRAYTKTGGADRDPVTAILTVVAIVAVITTTALTVRHYAGGTGQCVPEIGTNPNGINGVGGISWQCR